MTRVGSQRHSKKKMGRRVPGPANCDETEEKTAKILNQTTEQECQLPHHDVE
jgi:hypothetical protein